MLARGFDVTQVVLQQTGEPGVRLRKIRVEGNGGAEGLSRAWVFPHSGQRTRKQEMGQRILMGPLQGIQGRIHSIVVFPLPQSDSAQSDVGLGVIGIDCQCLPVCPPRVACTVEAQIQVCNLQEQVRPGGL